MGKYLVEYGFGNEIETNSRNARQHLINLGGDRIVVTTKNGKFVCEAWKTDEGIQISTKKW